MRCVRRSTNTPATEIMGWRRATAADDDPPEGLGDDLWEVVSEIAQSDAPYTLPGLAVAVAFTALDDGVGPIVPDDDIEGDVRETRDERLMRRLITGIVRITGVDALPQSPGP